jgi:hypothetical protein
MCTIALLAPQTHSFFKISNFLYAHLLEIVLVALGGGIVLVLGRLLSIALENCGRAQRSRLEEGETGAASPRGHAARSGFSWRFSSLVGLGQGRPQRYASTGRYQARTRGTDHAEYQALLLPLR